MRYLTIFILTLFVSTSLFAQKKPKLSKEDKKIAKEWKKKKKKMSPLDLKKLIEDKESLTTRSAEIDQEISELKGQISTKENEIATIKGENNKLRLDNSNSKKGAVDESGVLYKVQIGAFRELDLTSQTASSDLRVDETDDGIKRYIIGRFRELGDAEKFKTYVQRMGVRDAFIVGYRDGTRDESLIEH